MLCVRNVLWRVLCGWQQTGITLAKTTHIRILELLSRIWRLFAPQVPHIFYEHTYIYNVLQSDNQMSRKSKISKIWIYSSTVQFLVYVVREHIDYIFIEKNSFIVWIHSWLKTQSYIEHVRITSHSWCTHYEHMLTNNHKHMEILHLDPDRPHIFFKLYLPYATVCHCLRLRQHYRHHNRDHHSAIKFGLVHSCASLFSQYRSTCNGFFSLFNTDLHASRKSARSEIAPHYIIMLSSSAQYVFVRACTLLRTQTGRCVPNSHVVVNAWRCFRAFVRIYFFLYWNCYISAAWLNISKACFTRCYCFEPYTVLSVVWNGNNRGDDLRVNGRIMILEKCATS